MIKMALFAAIGVAVGLGFVNAGAVGECPSTIELQEKH